MLWSEVRVAFPNQWLVIEALKAHTAPDSKRLLDQLAIIEACPDGSAAMQCYRQFHQQFPQREFYFVHTGRVALDIFERKQVGIRRTQATVAY